MSNDNQRRVNSDKLLSIFALTALISGIVAGGAFLIASATVYNTSPLDFPGSNGFNLDYLGIGIIVFIQGFFFYALLKGFSDIIYLLKNLKN